jgi:hypothetical protein
MQLKRQQSIKMKIEQLDKLTMAKNIMFKRRKSFAVDVHGNSEN